MDLLTNLSSLSYVTAAALLLMGLDVLSGYGQAIANNCVQSHKLFIGLFHKFGEILLIITGYLIDVLQRFVDLGINFPIIEMILVYIIFYEINSIMENIVLLNPDLSTNPLFDIFKKEDKNE